MNKRKMKKKCKETENGCMNGDRREDSEQIKASEKSLWLTQTKQSNVT